LFSGETVVPKETVNKNTSVLCWSPQVSV